MTLLPLYVLAVLSAATGLTKTSGWPLNQNGLPAASRTLLTVLAGSRTASGGGVLPLIGNVTVWKPSNSQRTVSPLWAVTLCGKKEFADACLGAPLAVSRPA